MFTFYLCNYNNTWFMSAGVKDIKVSSLSQLLLGWQKRGKNSKSLRLHHTHIHSALGIVPGFWDLHLNSTQIWMGGRCKVHYSSHCTHVILPRCPSSLFVWLHQVHMASWLKLGTQEFFGKAAWKTILLAVCPGALPLWGLPLWGFATSLVSFKGCASPPRLSLHYLSFTSPALQRKK